MDAKELRIGNYIDILGEPIEVGWHIISEVYARNKGSFSPAYKDVEWKALPLTEEWLLRFGFYKHGLVFVFQPDLKNIEYRVTHFVGADWNVSKGFYNYNHELCLVKHVHQLQNLIYVLEREELVLKDL